MPHFWQRLIACFLLLTPVALAQDWQNRAILHLQADIVKHWFVPVWSISNFRSETADNANLFFGFGRRGEGWWLEVMLQRQWSLRGSQWMLDLRFDRQWSLWHLYAETAPFLSKQAFYESAILERRTWGRIMAGAEIENLHQSDRDAVQAGPRVSRRLGRFAGFEVSLAGAVRFSANGGHAEPRLYLVFNRRITRGGRK